MQNVVKISDESINYLILVTQQNAPETADWLTRLRDNRTYIHYARPLYVAKDVPSSFDSDRVVPYITMDEAYVQNNADKFQIAHYLY